MKTFDVFLFKQSFDVPLNKKVFEVDLHEERFNVFLHKEDVIEVQVPIRQNSDGSYFVMEDGSTPFVSENGQSTFKPE